MLPKKSVQSVMKGFNKTIQELKAIATNGRKANDNRQKQKNVLDAEISSTAVEIHKAEKIAANLESLIK